MPLLIYPFRNMSILFMKFKPYHCDFIEIWYVPLHTPSKHYQNCLDQNTLFLPSSFPSSLFPFTIEQCQETAASPWRAASAGTGCRCSAARRERQHRRSSLGIRGSMSASPPQCCCSLSSLTVDHGRERLQRRVVDAGLDVIAAALSRRTSLGDGWASGGHGMDVLLHK